MQFELKCGKNKHEQDGRQPMKYTFDQVNGIGIVVYAHENRDDEEGTRIENCRRGDKSCAYKVHVHDEIKVYLSLHPVVSEMLLTPVLGLADGSKQVFRAFKLNAGDLYRLPQNLQMDAGEDPNFWIIRNEQNEVVLEIMIRVD